MMKKILFAVLLALSCLPLAAQDVYVATDKGCYLAGENIGCSAFCAEGPSVVLLELVSSDGVAAMGKLAVAGGRGAAVLRRPSPVPGRCESARAGPGSPKGGRSAASASRAALPGAAYRACPPEASAGSYP